MKILFKSEEEEVLGNCPACNAHVTEMPKAYGCSNWRNGCKFTIWKTISKFRKQVSSMCNPMSELISVKKKEAAQFLFFGQLPFDSGKLL